MAKHLDANRLSVRSENMLFVNLPINVGHLRHVQLACQNCHIGKLGVKLQRVDIRYVQLGREMHLHAHLSAIQHHGNIAGDNGRHLRFFCSVYDGVHRVEVFAIDNRVHREIAFHAMLTTSGGDVAQVVDGELVGRMRPHV